MRANFAASSGGRLPRQAMCVSGRSSIMPQPKISRHLAYLRRTGIVGARREGKWMHYRLLMPQEPHAASILESTLKAFQQDKDMQRDLARLRRACCGPKSLVEAIGAPVPARVTA